MTDNVSLDTQIDSKKVDDHDLYANMVISIASGEYSFILFRRDSRDLKKFPGGVAIQGNEYLETRMRTLYSGFSKYVTSLEGGQKVSYAGGTVSVTLKKDFNPIPLEITTEKKDNFTKIKNEIENKKNISGGINENVDIFPVVCDWNRHLKYISKKIKVIEPNFYFKRRDS